MSNLEQAVTTLAQSRKLYELGFRKPSLYKRQVINDMKPIIVESNRGYTISGQVTHYYPAYLLSEIMEALPKDLPHQNKDGFLMYILVIAPMNMRYINIGKEVLHSVSISNDNIIEAAGDLIIWCIENGFISTK